MKKYSLALLFFSMAISVNSYAIQEKSYDFKVFLGDKEIGFHKFMVTPHKDQTYVNSEANFDVKFLFISAYTYLHQNSEVWKGNCLQAINATTDDNGDVLYVRGKYREQTLNLQTHKGQKKLEGCIKTFAYWDPSLLNSNKLLNVQTGKLEEVNIEVLGESQINRNGTLIRANHYRINNPKFNIDLWYSDNKEWLALESTTENGARLRYLAQ